MDKHPKSLRIFFATEMWERYGFYVVQSLLALYLVSHFKWPDERIYALVGSFTALTYLSPLIGGWIADHLIGQKKSILLGAFVLGVSYCLLSFIHSNMILTASLAGVAVGTGLLKPSISSLLGNEYKLDSANRESGFTIFYMGITSGIILGTTLPSYLSESLGWPAAFFSATIGMMIALTVFSFGIIRYRIEDYNPAPLQFKNIIKAILLIGGLWALSFYILNDPQIANIIFVLVVLFSTIYMLYSVNHEPAEQSRQTLVIGLLCLISVLFWAFYFQMFMSLTLFIMRLVQPTLGGISFPPPYYVTIQSIGMLVIGYFLAKKNRSMTMTERGLSAGKKFLIAMLLMNVAYFIIALATNYMDKDILISPLLIIPAYLCISAAELLLSPVGIAAVTLLAHRKKVSTMMGIFFVSLGIGGFLSGKLANLTAIPYGEHDLADLKHLYATAFIQQVEILFLATMGCLLIYALIKFLLTYNQK